ncbi:MAG: hypothetical protein K2X03_06630 [Bryobacteraceae bacterium]|nr:hypothetical protein [Bryobacteraceae bacterium]
MTLLWCISWLLAEPYWEAVPADKWSEQQLSQLLSNSPWAQPAPDTSRGPVPGPPVVIYLASAAPMRQAEEEILRRRFKQKADLYAAAREAREEYLAYLDEHAGKVIVVAVPLSPDALADSAETKRMDKESLLRIGKRKWKATGHFPPTPSDPTLRLIFPREALEGAKEIDVEVYLPSLAGPYRNAQFLVKDLVLRGQPEL